MANEDMINIIRKQIGEVARSKGFRDAVRSTDPDHLKQLLQARLTHLGIDARLFSVKPSPGNSHGDFEIEWQPSSGGAFTQHFSFD